MVFYDKLLNETMKIILRNSATTILFVANFDLEKLVALKLIYFKHLYIVLSEFNYDTELALFEKL